MAAKTDRENLLVAVAEDFHTYLRRGVRVERVVGAAHPNLDIDDVETLLRIHFLLTEAAPDSTDEDDVGVVDFVRSLDDRIRRVKTSTSAASFERRGDVRGRIDWPATAKRRARVGRFDEPLFVCTQPEEHYDVDENLVLKRLLAVVSEILETDVVAVVDSPDRYEWLSPWFDPDPRPNAGGTDTLSRDGDGDTGSDGDDTAADRHTPRPAAEVLSEVADRNVYLQRIDATAGDVTDRTIEAVKRSRSRLYREAAVLLDRYRRLMDRALDSAAARAILDTTLIAPGETDTLFELYWIFRVLDTFEGVQYRVLTDRRARPSTVARWDHGGYRYVLSHDAAGVDTAFRESLDPASVQPDGYLFRSAQVQSRWRTLAAELLGYDAGDTLWGGRPDIVLERYALDGDETDLDADERDHGASRGGHAGDDPDPVTQAEAWTLDRVFIGEVKYTRDVGYAAAGLRELLEYMAFVRHAGAGGDYVEAPADVLESVSVHGTLFTDDLPLDSPASTLDADAGRGFSRDTDPSVDVVQFGETIGDVFP